MSWTINLSHEQYKTEKLALKKGLLKTVGFCLWLKQSCPIIKFILNEEIERNEFKTTFDGKYNGTEWFKNVSNYFNSNIYSYLETYGGRSYTLYLNVVHFFNTCVN
jgi:hypothetical protein